jgi:hypothetical protein
MRITFSPSTINLKYSSKEKALMGKYFIIPKIFRTREEFLSHGIDFLFTYTSVAYFLLWNGFSYSNFYAFSPHSYKTGFYSINRGMFFFPDNSDFLIPHPVPDRELLVNEIGENFLYFMRVVISLSNPDSMDILKLKEHPRIEPFSFSESNGELDIKIEDKVRPAFYKVIA